MDEETQELSLRQKGDLYWKKRKKLMASAARLSYVDGGRKGMATALKESNVTLGSAEEIMEWYRKAKPQEDLIRLTGNEFKDRPPTACGDAAYQEAILTAMRARDQYRMLLNRPQKKERSVVETVWVENLNQVLETIDSTLKQWFAATGLDADTGERIDLQDRDEARASLPAALDSYARKMSNFNRETSLKSIKAVLDLIPEKPDDTEPENDPALVELPQSYAMNEAKGQKKAEKILKEEISVQKKINRVLSRRKDLEEYLDKEIAEYGAESMRVLLLMESLREFSLYCQDQLNALYFKKICCTYYARWLAHGDALGPLMVEYIERRWHELPDSVDVTQEIRSLPNYHVFTMDEMNPPKQEVNDMEGFRRIAKELKDYRSSHKDQFDGQTLMSVFFGIEKLPVIAQMARDLKDGIDRATEGGKGASFSKEEQEELEEYWLLAETMASVASLVMGFTLNHDRKTFTQLIENIPPDLFEMGYSVRERALELPLMRIFAERFHPYNG